jgi:mannose-6-phosphate isomerase-like protein (cupin superfamily)
MIAKCKSLPVQADYIAPGGFKIRLLPETKKGSCAHSTLPAGQTLLAVEHKTIVEIWYVLSGQGEICKEAEMMNR